MPGDRRARVRGWTPLLAWPLCAPLAAQSELLQLAPVPVPFARQERNSNNGLPQNSANALLQARDGHFWIGTYGGLCRLDGERIDVFDTVTAPGLRSNRVVCLHEAPDATLWIGSDQSGLASLREGRFQAHPELTQTSIQALATDAAGCLLVATSTHLLRREGDTFRPVHADRLANVRRLLVRRSGTCLAVAASGLFEFDEREVRQLSHGTALCVAELGEEVLLGTARGLFRLGGDGLEPWAPLAALRSSVFDLLVASDGALWVGTAHGPVRVDRENLTELSHAPLADRADPAPQARAARTLHEDREGGIWIGHSESGVTRLRAAEVLGHRIECGLPPRGIVAVLGDGQGELYVGTSQGLFHGQAGRFAPVPGTAALGSCRGMLLDPDGTLWFATREGLARLDARGVELWLDSQAWPTSQVRAILREPDGTHWLAGGAGLAHLVGRSVSVPPVAEALRQESLRSLATAPDGALWVGGAALLARIDPARTTLRTWRSGNELPFGEVRAILPEAGERAWIATYGGGLVLVDGERVTPVDERHGLLDQSLCAALPLGADLVVASNSGFYLVRRQALEDVATGRAGNLACRPLRTEGSRTAECDGGLQPCASEVGGKLWFCGIDALHEFDPALLEPLRQDLPVQLEHLYLGESRWTGGLDVRLPRGVRTLDIRLAACAFDYPAETRFRWRVHGHLPEWSEPSYARDARLVDLPSGELLFEAEGVDLEGRASSVPLQLALHVPALLHETGAFRVSALVVVVLGGLLLVRLGARRSARRATELQRLVDERTGELRQAQQNLEHRVEERTHELRSALLQQELEQAERRRLERQLLHMQRMESIGQLAGGIAHDFNNLLTIASGSSELLERHVAGTEANALCRNIAQACERGRGLTQHLLAVASRQLVTTARLDLNRVVADLLPVLRSLLGDDVNLRFEPASGAAPVQAAVTQIEQILLNVAANARDAMPQGGTLTIRLACAPARVTLTLADEGEGMPPELVERVFEPFFSTRRSPGRGLGLTTVYGVTKQLGGEVHIESAVGRGTTVRITLPRVDAAEEGPTVESPTTTSRRLPGTVLLVEDQPDVRRVVKLLLESLGCRVVEAGDGALAEEILREEPARIDAVLSDVVMPGLQGRRLVDVLRALRPGLPIVFMSGYYDGRLSHQDLQEMGLEILPKPLDRARLASSLERVQAGAESARSPR